MTTFQNLMNPRLAADGWQVGGVKDGIPTFVREVGGWTMEVTLRPGLTEQERAEALHPAGAQEALGWTYTIAKDGAEYTSRAMRNSTLAWMMVKAVDRARFEDDNPRLTPGEIRTVRETLGLSSDKMGDLLGNRGDTVRKWESGKDQVPHRIPETLVRVIGEQIEKLRDLQDAMAARVLE